MPTEPLPADPGPPPADPAPLPADKPSLRRHYRSRRRQALAAGASDRLRQVACSALPSRVAPGQWLGLYWPIAGEPDLDPWAPGGLAERLAASGCGERLALPAVLPPCGGESHGRLLYLPWRRGAALRPDACGIPAPLPPAGVSALEVAEAGSEPARSGRMVAVPSAVANPLQALAPEDLDLLLVPALALDRVGLRLGSGGGWYDRLRRDPRWRSVPALAVLPSACRCEALPADPWDIPFDGWLDEHGLGWCVPA